MTHPILPQLPNKIDELIVKDFYLPRGCIKKFHQILRSMGVCDLQLITYDLCTEIKNSNPFTKVVQQAIEASIQEAGERLQSIPSDRHYLWTIGRFACHLIRILEDLKVARSSILTSETLTVVLDLFSSLYLNTLDLSIGRRYDIAISTCKLVSILAQLPEMITDEMMRSLHQLVRRREGRDRDDWFLLLTTCTHIPTADLNAAVRLLLKAGADANASDEEGSNALHRLAWKWFETEQLEESLNVVVGELIKGGAHLDQVSTDDTLGKITPTDIWKRRHKGRKLPSWCRSVPSLSCLSATSLKHPGKPYDETSLPVTLHSFVALH